MPVITVDKQKIAIPKHTKLFVAIRKLCPTYRAVFLNGKRLPLDFDYEMQDGDNLQTYITVHEEDGPSHTFIKGTTVDAFLKMIDCPTHYLIVEGEVASADEVLQHGDTIEIKECITINLQGNLTFVPEETTILDLYRQYHWTSSTGKLTVNGKEAALTQPVFNGDDIRCQ